MRAQILPFPVESVFKTLSALLVRPVRRSTDHLTVAAVEDLVVLMEEDMVLPLPLLLLLMVNYTI